MSVRISLTLWYTFLLGAILVSFSALLYSVLVLVLYKQVDQNLQDRAHQIGNRIQVETVFRLTGEQAGEAVLPPLDVFSSSAIFVQVINSEGELIESTDNLGGHRLTNEREIKTINETGQASFSTVTIENTRIRVYSAPIIIAGPPRQVVGAVQVGQSLQFIDIMLRMVFFFLTGGTIIALVLAALMGAFLARKALTPIERINQTAARIVNGQDLKQRLATPATNDEISRLTTTINDMLARLDNFFQAQVRLSADVSHELRTPLTTIRGNIDLLRSGAASDPQELNEALTVIDSELDRMARIVSDLLLLSQADAGMSLRLEPVELDTIVLEVYRQARVIADGIGIQLGHEDQALVEGDADRLKQLLINLVTNAIKHTSPGGRITLSLYRDHEWVRVTVEDTGRGIAPTALPHIFERFYRADEAAGQKGTGLGLSIAQWIAQAHGGQITVESQLGQGSTFTLWLPNNFDRQRKATPVEILAVQD
jgi:heavy metal sensor kinase